MSCLRLGSSHRIKMVVIERFELPTSPLSAERSNQLSYITIIRHPDSSLSPLGTADTIQLVAGVANNFTQFFLSAYITGGEAVNLILQLVRIISSGAEGDHPIWARILLRPCLPLSCQSLETLFYFLMVH